MDKEKEIPDTIKNREPEEAPALAGESSERLPGREDLPRHIRENLKKLPDKPGIQLPDDSIVPITLIFPTRMSQICGSSSMELFRRKCPMRVM